mgnify:CR=1 FL=1
MTDVTPGPGRSLYVSALTGYVVDSSGQRLWFSVQVRGNLSASTRNAIIDRAVTALAG